MECVSPMRLHILILIFPLKQLFDIILFNTRYFVFLLFLGLAEMKYKVTNYGNLRVFVEAGFRLLKIRIQNRKFTANYERSL